MVFIDINFRNSKHIRTMRYWVIFHFKITDSLIDYRTKKKRIGIVFTEQLTKNKNALKLIVIIIK